VAWHFIVTDTAGNAIGEITNATSRTVNWYLKEAPHSVTFTMNARDPQALMIQELMTDLLVYRDGWATPLFRGRFISSQDTIGAPGGIPGGTDPNAHTVNFNAVSYKGMLDYRLIETNPSYTTVDQSTIAWNLIVATQALAGGNWNITRGTTPASVNRTQAFVAGSLIGDAIDSIATLNQGFDWDINPNMTFQTWPLPPLNIYTAQGRGQNIGMVLRLGDNVTNAQRTIDTTQYANVIFYSGASSLSPDIVDIQSQNIYGGSFGAAGRWEYADSNTNITDAATLNGAALGDLLQRGILLPTYALTLKSGFWNPSLVWLGDIVTVYVRHGRLNDNYVSRVSEVDLFISDEGNEEHIVVTVGPTPGNLLTTVKNLETTLEQVAKNL